MNFSGSHPINSEASLSFSKILLSAWVEFALLRSCLSADLTVLNVLLRTEECRGTSPRGRSFNEQF